MSLTSVIICHGGRWESSRSGYGHYVGYTTVAVSVRKKTGYAEILNVVCHRIGLNIDLCTVTLRFPVPNSYAPGMTCVLSSHDEAAAFWKFNRKSNAVPILIDVESRQLAGHVFAGGNGENVVPPQYQHYISTSDSKQSFHYPQQFRMWKCIRVHLRTFIIPKQDNILTQH